MLCPRHEHELSRRAWLGTSAAVLGAAPFGFSPIEAIASEAAQRNKQVLFLWIDGGMSQFESWDPKPNTRFGGPLRAIPTSVPGVHFSELLPRSAKLMHLLSVVRSVSTQDNSHSAGVARIQRGDPKNRGVTYPFFGSAIAKWIGSGNSGLPPYVSIKPGNGGFLAGEAGFLGASYGPIAFGDGKPPENLARPPEITEEADARRQKLRLKLNEGYAVGRRPAAAEANSHVFDLGHSLMKRQELFDTSKFDPRDVERYGTHDFGRHVLQARKMLEAGVTFVKVTSYGWDTHADNFNAHMSMMPKFDQAFASVVEDLSERGMLDNVLVIALSEFGRTPRINGAVGRDHFPEAWSIAMAGAGLKHGVVVGKTNAEGTAVDENPYDIGHLFHTWFHALGIDSKQVEYDNRGQPLPIAHDDCHPIKELLA